MSLSLNCLVLGDDPNRVFTVEIAKTKNISMLKDLIKQKQAPRLNHLPATDLKLWQGSFPVNNLETELTQFRFAHDRMLKPTAELDTIFTDVASNNLHVVVKAPEAQAVVAAHSTQLLSLNCLMFGDDGGKIFPVDIESSQKFGFLKKLIKENVAPRLNHLAVTDLELWQGSFPIDDLPSRPSPSDDRFVRLLPISRISEFFTTALSDENVHIFIELPATDTVAPLAPLSDLSNLRMERGKFTAAFPVEAPSAPSAFSKLQEAQNKKIVWSRPPSADATIPVTLLHPIFRQFIDDSKSHHPTQEDNNLVLNLMAEMSEFFLDKCSRAAELHNILKEYGVPVVTSTITSKGHQFFTDGCIEVDGYHIVIIKVQGEVSSKGAEPYAQAILNYTYSTMAKALDHSKFNFPALLITVFGPHISFSGAVWTSRPHFQVLTPALPLFYHHSDTTMRESLARHFGAFKKAIQSLKQCYEALRNPALLENLNSEFPDPRTYRSLEADTTVNFKYLYQLDEKKLLFMGETDDKERICIKFVRQYSRAAHAKCAQMGIAPKLKGFEDIGAGWKIVVMDPLDKEYTYFDKEFLPAHTHEQIRERLVELHQANFVHGDVRTANIMIRKDGKPGFMLIDFDWSGIIGEVRYPMNVNKVDLWRPDNVADGLLIKPDDDIAMLDYIFR